MLPELLEREDTAAMLQCAVCWLAQPQARRQRQEREKPTPDSHHYAPGLLFAHL